MIAFVTFLGVVGCGLCFIYHVAFSPIGDSVPASSRHSPVHTGSDTDNLDSLASNTTATWTVLDDIQLSRLLEGPV